MIKAISTKYKGYNFRSRLEARWAIYFDEIGLVWEYEVEGYEFEDGTRYLPDFYIPEFGYIEIKSDISNLSKEEIHKMDLFGKEKTLLLITGCPSEDIDGYNFWTDKDGFGNDINFNKYSVRKWGQIPYYGWNKDLYDEDDINAIHKAKSTRFEFGDKQ